MSTIVLPYPPTANLYWRHARGRTFLSAAAKAFKEEVRTRLLAAKIAPQTGPLILNVHMYRPRRVGDLDNTLKVLCDALNKLAWHDDSQVVEIHAWRHDDKADPRAEVEVVAVGHTPRRSTGVDVAKDEPFTRKDARAALEHPAGCTCRPCSRVDAAIAAAKEADETFAAPATSSGMGHALHAQEERRCNQCCKVIPAWRMGPCSACDDAYTPPNGGAR